jgi:anti-sigma regulatory factor (Ser/Thr protein kinase)
MEVIRRRFRNGDPAQPLRHSARHALRQSACNGADADWIDDVVLVISELVQNVSQHTHGPGELVVSVEPGMVLVEVGDSDTTTPDTRRADGDGGRGLLLIEAVSRKWGVRTCPSGKVVWAQVPAVPDPVVQGAR